uniref:Uncharacterized protein n=2 Tax=Pseudo-nitzschia australis TaxID=44445 RepID=A0A7S4AG04_9STRA
MRRTATIDDDRCRRVMRKFRKRRRERTSSIATLTRLRPSLAIGGSEAFQSPRIKRRTTATTASCGITTDETNGNDNGNGNGKDGDNSDDNGNDSYGVKSSRLDHDRDHDQNPGSGFLPQYNDRRFRLNSNSSLNLNHRRRKNRVAWGERIARKRAFGSAKNQNRSSVAPKTPELVHRKPESMHTFSYYSRCTFLDSCCNKVLAVDNRGTLDLIRLAELRSHSHFYSQTNKERTRSASHQKIVTDFELGASLNLQSQQSFAFAHLQALSGGSTVAFGLGDNTLCLLDLEGRTNYTYFDSNCNDNGNSNNNNNNDKLIPVPLSGCTHSSSLQSSLFCAWRTQHPRRTYYRDRRNPKLSIYELCRHRMPTDRNRNRNNIHSGGESANTNGLSDTNCFHTSTISTTSSTSTSIYDDTSGAFSDLHAIDYTSGRERIASPIRFVPGVTPPDDAHWDVLEVHPSSCNRSTNSLLYVAHVDSDYDAFWTQVLDGRVRATTKTTNKTKTTNTNTTKSSGNSRTATAVLIDGTTRDRPGKAEEHTTACAMVTDICMATAHIFCGNYGSTPASEFFDRGLPYAGCSGMSSCVKLWDLRMAKRKKKPTMMKDYPIPADTIALSSSSSSSASSSIFQHATVAVVEPSATIQTRLTSGEGALAFSEASFAGERSGTGCGFAVEKESPFVGSDRVVTNLSAARDSYYSCGTNNNGSTRCGSLIVTTQSRTKSTHIEHSKLDLSGTMRMVRTISQTNPSLGCQPVYAVASSHGYVATCSNRKKNNFAPGDIVVDGSPGDGSSGASTRLCLYDFNEACPPTKSASLEGRRNYSYPKLLRRQQREDPTFRFRMDAFLTDRYGIETELSCIAMNSNGTALLGGSTDGDLFVWRGI